MGVQGYGKRAQTPLRNACRISSKCTLAGWARGAFVVCKSVEGMRSRGRRHACVMVVTGLQGPETPPGGQARRCGGRWRRP
eukprot:5723519-Pyramimonas_sp.AAC.1